jgi:hypothetical protein
VSDILSVIGGVRGYCAEPEPEQLLKMARVPDRHKKTRAGVRGRVCVRKLIVPILMSRPVAVVI